MARGKVNPSDVTGRQREAAQKAHAAEQQEAAERMSMITATKARDDATTITDLTGSGPVELSYEELSDEERAEIEYVDAEDDAVIEDARVEGPVPFSADHEPPEERGFPGEGEPALTEIVHSRPLRVRPTTKVIRVNTDLDAVTVGYGNTYAFVEGRKYRVPSEVADHLEGLGYVWH